MIWRSPWATLPVEHVQRAKVEELVLLPGATPVTFKKFHKCPYLALVVRVQWQAKGESKSERLELGGTTSETVGDGTIVSSGVASPIPYTQQREWH